MCNVRCTQYTIDQQPLDTELAKARAKEVFRKHFAELTKLMSVATNRLTVAAELREELITEECMMKLFDDSPRTDMVKRTSLAKATINSQPQLIIKLISILEKLKTFNLLPNKL